MLPILITVAVLVLFVIILLVTFKVHKRCKRNRIQTFTIDDDFEDVAMNNILCFSNPPETSV